MRTVEITSILMATIASSMAFLSINSGNARGTRNLSSTSSTLLPSLSSAPSLSSSSSCTKTSTAVFMANDEDLQRWARSARSAGFNDRVVELKRPLGLILNEDDSGNVFVENVAPRGNAARTGMVKEGDIVVMCSATFGDQLWSTRGAGLSRVLSAIRIRAGPTIKLALESTNENASRAKMSSKNADAAREAKARAQGKRDQLMDELKNDEKRLKK